MLHHMTNSFLFEIGGHHKPLQNTIPKLPKRSNLNKRKIYII